MALPMRKHWALLRPPSACFCVNRKGESIFETGSCQALVRLLRFRQPTKDRPRVCVLFLVTCIFRYDNSLPHLFGSVYRGTLWYWSRHILFFTADGFAFYCGGWDCFHRVRFSSQCDFRIGKVVAYCVWRRIARVRFGRMA